jgi:hypothetical protein
MKQAKTIFMFLIMILICCSYSIGQSSSGIGIKGNIGAATIGIINNGAHVYPVGEYGANISLPLREFQCNLMSACGIYNVAQVSDGAIVNLGGVRRVTIGATVYHRIPSKSSLNTSP